jgi:hypothetical protein
MTGSQKVEQLLEHPQEEEDASAPSADASTTPTSDPVYDMIPIKLKNLCPLAASLALRSHGADWISWVGASLWAATWKEYDNTVDHFANKQIRVPMQCKLSTTQSRPIRSKG